MESDHGRVVCVTGGTGYVASWLIMKLLHLGYSVHTTVRRNPGRDLGFLINLPGAPTNLKIYEADMSDPDTFRPAIQGCTGVFHVATPVDFCNNEPEDVLVRRAVEGTLGILNLCLAARTVKRVVYTSSAAAVQYSRHKAEVMDESYWSDADTIEANNHLGGSYALSKTLTEKAVLEFAEEIKKGKKSMMEVVSIVPSVVVGPFITPTIPSSVRASLALVFGEVGLYDFLLNTCMVHIDDVTAAHVFLMECPNVEERYICSSHNMTIQEIATFLATHYPELANFIPNPESLMAKIKGPRCASLSSQKLINCGFRYKHEVKDMFDGAIQCCKKGNYLPPMVQPQLGR